jgi:hypothetical protein
MRDTPIPAVAQAIQTIRQQRVILSSHLAEIYGVEPRALNQAVKRNRARFPSDFAFRLTRAEAIEAQRSRSHSVILKRGQNIKYLPLAFTEHGAIEALVAGQRRAGVLRKLAPAADVRLLTARPGRHHA